MLTHLGDLGFIGDLSAQDADILCKYAKQSKHILEFGVGGSTQLLAQCQPELLISIDTDPIWIKRTKEILKRIRYRTGNETEVTFYSYQDLSNAIKDHTFDMIFVDGYDQLRREFAFNTWKSLRIGGVMIFHDTRHFGHVQTLLAVAQEFFLEVEAIKTNAIASNNKSSNMSIIRKKVWEPYQDWNLVEGKPTWASGYAPMTDDLPLWYPNKDSK